MDKEFEIRFIADNDAKRSKGLMFAEPLEDNEVVFFIFPHSDFLSFWNKNVSFDLSLAFFLKKILQNHKIINFSYLYLNINQLL